MANPLFPNTEAAQRQARAEFRKTGLGQLMATAEGLAAKQNRRPGETDELRQMGMRALRSGILKGTQSTPIGQFAHSVNKFGAGRMMKEAALNALFRELGPVGSLLRGVLMPSGGGTRSDRELQAAKEFLEAHGFEVTDKRDQTPGQTAAERHADMMNALGITPQDAPGQQQQTDAWDQPFDPGEAEEMYAPELNWMSVNNSSNVHSIAYDEDASTMYVRYLGGSAQSRGGVGPTYAYLSVPPGVFNSIAMSASKGVAIWNQIRVRGENHQFEHQYRYELVALGSGGYVPRQATKVGYRPRRVRHDGMVRSSILRGTGSFENMRGRQTARGMTPLASNLL